VQARGLPSSGGWAQRAACSAGSRRRPAASAGAIARSGGVQAAIPLGPSRHRATARPGGSAPWRADRAGHLCRRPARLRQDHRPRPVGRAQGASGGMGLGRPARQRPGGAAELHRRRPGPGRADRRGRVPDPCRARRLGHRHRGAPAGGRGLGNDPAGRPGPRQPGAARQPGVAGRGRRTGTTAPTRLAGRARLTAHPGLAGGAATCPGPGGGGRGRRARRKRGPCWRPRALRFRMPRRRSWSVAPRGGRRGCIWPRWP
jgi:hypothetical protein